MSNIDMLPESYREEKQKYRVDMVCVIFFAVMMVILVVVEFNTGRDFDSIRQRHQTNAAKFEQRDQEIKQYTTDKIKRAGATTQLRTMLDLTARFPCSRIFAEIADKQLFVSPNKRNASGRSSSKMRSTLTITLAIVSAAFLPAASKKTSGFRMPRSSKNT